MVTYWGTAMALGESYPISPLMMFSVPETAASRVIVRDGNSGYAEVGAYDRWNCGEPIELGGRCSPGFSAQDELVMEILRQRRDNSATEATNVTLVRRVFRVRSEDRGLDVSECDLMTCRARRIAR